MGHTQIEQLAAGMNEEISRQNVVLEAYVRRVAELTEALGKAIDYCDAATHGDGQYHDERSSLIRVYRGQ